MNQKYEKYIYILVFIYILMYNRRKIFYFLRKLDSYINRNIIGHLIANNVLLLIDSGIM